MISEKLVSIPLRGIWSLRLSDWLDMGSGVKSFNPLAGNLVFATEQFFVDGQCPGLLRVSIPLRGIWSLRRWVSMGRNG